MSPTTGHDTIDRLMPAVYDELREVASRRLAGQSGGTLTRTRLVHEAYLRKAARPERVIDCRCFGGMRGEEIASGLGVTVRTVQRDWSKARMLRRRALDW